MNVFSRALICALLLGGITQPVDWKYIIPWTAAVVGFGGCIGLGVLYKQDKDRINQLIKDHQDKEKQYEDELGQHKDKIDQLTQTVSTKETEIWELQSQTGSINRKKGSKKGIYEDKELTLLKKEVAAKNGIIKQLEEKWNKFYTDYFHLMSAMDEELLSHQKYVIDVGQLNPKASLGVLIGGKIYYLIEESKFYLPSEIYTDATIGMWQSQRGQTISKGTASEMRLAAPLEPSYLPLPPEKPAPALTAVTFIPPTEEQTTNTLEGQKKYNRLSKATIANEIEDLFKKVSELNKVSNSNNG